MNICSTTLLATEPRYLAITDAELVYDYPELFDTLMDFAFDQLSVHHLTIQVIEGGSSPVCSDASHI